MISKVLSVFLPVLLQASGSGGYSQIIFILILLFLVAFLAGRNKPIDIISDWQHNFPSLQFSAQEFYKRIEEEVKRYEYPNITFKRVNYFEGGILSSKREYLRISRNEYSFLICAAPFGTDFFVSWRLGESEESIIAKIPILNSLLGKNRRHKTFYQLDTEAMFKGAIHNTVLALMDEITTEKGGRGLSDGDRKYNDNRK